MLGGIFQSAGWPGVVTVMGNWFGDKKTGKLQFLSLFSFFLNLQILWKDIFFISSIRKFSQRNENNKFQCVQY